MNVHHLLNAIFSLSEKWRICLRGNWFNTDVYRRIKSYQIKYSGIHLYLLNLFCLILTSVSFFVAFLLLVHKGCIFQYLVLSSEICLICSAHKTKLPPWIYKITLYCIVELPLSGCMAWHDISLLTQTYCIL